MEIPPGTVREKPPKASVKLDITAKYDGIGCNPLQRFMLELLRGLKVSPTDFKANI